MKVYIASNDSTVTAALRACFEQLKIDCPAARVVGHEAIPLVPFGDSTADIPVVFFAGRQLGPDELSVLKQLCSDGGRALKVVVVGVDLSPPVILQAIRTGASDCLDIHRNLEPELREVLARLAAAQNVGHRASHMLSVIASGGGAGATLVAVNLAAEFARRGLAAGLLDLHVRGGDAATFLNCRARHTLADLAAKDDHLDLAMFEQALVRHDSGICLLAGPEPFSDYRAIRTQLIPRVVQFARHVFTHVVIDLEDCDHEEQLRVLAASENILHIVRPDFVSVRRARKLHEFLSRAKVPRDHVTLVANRLGGPKALDERLIAEGLGMPVEHKLPEDSDAVNRSVNLGVPVVLAHPQAKMSQAIARLTDSLIGGHSASNGASWPRRQFDRLTAALTHH